MSNDDDYEVEMTNDHTPNDDHSDLDDFFAGLTNTAFAGDPVEPNAAVQEFVVTSPAISHGPAVAGQPVHDLGEVPITLDDAPNQPRRKPMFTAFATVFSTAAGKFVLAGGVAAASVVGAHSTGVVDVPLLPDTGNEVVIVQDDDDSSSSSSTSSSSSSTSTTSTTSTTVAPGAISDSSSSTSTTIDDDSSSDDRTTGPLRIEREVEVDVADRDLEVDVDIYGGGIDRNAIDQAEQRCDNAVDALDDDLGEAAWRADAAAALATCDAAYAAVLGSNWPGLGTLDAPVYDDDSDDYDDDSDEDDDDSDDSDEDDDDSDDDSDDSDEDDDDSDDDSDEDDDDSDDDSDEDDHEGESNDD